MTPAPDLLLQLVARYVWWKSPAEAIRMPERVVAQIMNIGSYDDIQRLVARVGDDYLRQVLRNAEAGQFNSCSWAYWHYRLGLPPDASMPPMPTRHLA